MPDFPCIHAVLCREKRVKKRVIAGLITALFWSFILKQVNLLNSDLVAMAIAVLGGKTYLDDFDRSRIRSSNWERCQIKECSSDLVAYFLFMRRRK